MKCCNEGCIYYTSTTNNNCLEYGNGREEDCDELLTINDYNRMFGLDNTKNSGDDRKII